METSPVSEPILKNKNFINQRSSDSSITLTSQCWSVSHNHEIYQSTKEHGNNVEKYVPLHSHEEDSRQSIYMQNQLDEWTPVSRYVPEFLNTNLDIPAENMQQQFFNYFVSVVGLLLEPSVIKKSDKQVY